MTPPAGLVAWYPFDEAAGTTAAEIAFGNNGTEFGSPLPAHVPGKIDGALSFNGANNYVESPDGPRLALRAALSIDAWVRLPTDLTNSVTTILDKRDPVTTYGYELYLSFKRLGIQLSGPGSPGGLGNYASPPIPTLTDGLWHHVAVTVKPGGNALFYFDGAQQGPAVPTKNPLSMVNSSPLRIGTQTAAAPFGGWFRGNLDELEIFNRVLSPAEVVSLATAFPPASAGKCKHVLTPRTTPVRAAAGRPFTASVLVFTDSYPALPASAYAATIDWGDGSPTSAGTVGGSDGEPFTVTGTHTYYAEGTYPVAVTIAVGGATATATSTAVVTRGGPHVVVGGPVHFAVSPPLSQIPPVVLPPLGVSEIAEAEPEVRSQPSFLSDPVLQTGPGTGTKLIAGPKITGVGQTSNSQLYYLPPDPNGDIGTDHYVQVVNQLIAIYKKNGTQVSVTPATTLWTGFPGACGATNNKKDADPIVVWDSLAKRWLVSRLASANYPSSPFDECIAISQTPDPTGKWYLYDFSPTTNFPDYPHFGVRPDGYYMSTNQGLAGQGVTVFDRAKMLVGDKTATFQYFDLGATGSSSPGFYGMLPADLDGRTPPPVGSPESFMGLSPSQNALWIWKLHVDWTTSTNSTFGAGPTYAPNTKLAVAPFTQLAASFGVPQPSTTVQLDPLGDDRLMFRLAYRNVGGQETLVANHTVDAGGGRAGVRWYEVGDPNGSPTILQQGTYVGGDTLHRFMGSIAQDGGGNDALAYSAGNSSTFPSIRRTGRLASDPLGVMSQAETTIVAGGGSQTMLFLGDPFGRWGDYTDMTVDPIDDCTFWYTNEYYAATSAASWLTNISLFAYPPGECKRKSDVWMKDKPVEYEGGEYDPATVGLNMWESEDIWVRQNGCDNGTANQNAEFGQTNCVYVQLRNRDQPASGTLEVYYAEAALGLSWPADWHLISSTPVSLVAGVGQKVAVPWMPPPPGATGHFCLLARWVSLSDPMTWAETTDPDFNTRYNNNIAWKNIHIVNLLAPPQLANAGGFIVRNTLPQTTNVDIDVRESDATSQDRFLAHGRVFVDLGPGLFAAWREGGFRGHGLGEIVGTKVRILDPEGASIENIRLASREEHVAQLLVQSGPLANLGPPVAELEVTQRATESGYLFGGITFEIRNFGLPATSESPSPLLATR